SPRTTTVTATASFATAAAALTVVPDALARLQVILAGEAAAPGSLTGKTGGASARVKGIPFSATVRAVDNYWNVISTITDTAALSISAASATLPAPQALSGGQAAFTGIVVYATGSFTLSATDLTQPGVLSATSAVFGVSPPSLTSPTLGGFVPNGARVATLGGGVSGFAADGSAVERVLVDLRDLDAGLHFDWSAQSFASGVPIFATATLGSPLTPGTTWFRAAADAAFADGHRFRLTAQAGNPTGLTSTATSTFTFDRGMLAFGAKDGQGFATVVPSTAAGCEEIVSTVTLTVGASGIGPGGALAVRAPAGWTLPLGTTTQYPPPLGYWHAASTSLAAASAIVSPDASGATALGPGWLLLSVATGSAQSYLPGQSVVLTYRARPPFGPAGRGPQSFEVMTRGDASGTLLPVSTAPVLALGAGTTSFLTFADPSPLSLRPLTASATMQFLVTDLCGNPKPGVSSGTVSLSPFVLGGGSAVLDTNAQFFNAAGVSISTVVLSTGLAAAASPSFSVWTSTDAPADLVLRASATFAGSGFAPIVVEAARPVRLRAALPVFTSVSVDTGTPSPGTTSALLSAFDPAGSAAQIRFTLADPDLSWEAVVSSDPLNFSWPVFSAVGSGDASRPIVLGWDGLDRTQSPPVYAAPGRYKVRLRAGGGAAVDRRLEIAVPETAGYMGRLGARGAGARVRASGPGAGDGRWAVASSTGYFELRGLRPGQAYELSAATAAVVIGRAVTLSTSVAAGAAASPLADLGTLGFPATAYLRVALMAPAPSPREVVGAFTARLPDGTAAFSGSLRLSSGSASSDDGGPLFGRAASTWSVASAAPGLYDVDIEIPDLGLSTRAAGVIVPAAGGLDLSVSLAKKANVFGYVVLPTTVPYGTFVTVQAQRTGMAEPGAYGGVFVSSAPPVSGPSSGAYALYGLDPGTWTVLARAPGFTASSATLFVAGTADVLGLNLAPGLGASITGSLSIPGDTRQATQCFPAPGGAAAACPAGSYDVEVEALGVGRLDRAAARLRLGAHVSFASSTFVLSGLDAGTYALRASLPGFGLAPPQGATVTVAAGGTAAVSFALSKLDARLRVDVQVPPLAAGACRSTSSYRSLGILLEPDGAAPLVFGDGTAMAPTAASARAQVSTVTGAFLLLHCSSATFFTPALPPGGARVTALFNANGGLARGRALLVDGTTAALSLDVSGATFAVTGSLSYSGLIGFSSRTAGGLSFTVAASSIPGLLGAAPSASFCLLGNGNPRTLSALRAELLPYDPVFPPLRRAAGSAAGLCAAPAASTAPFASAAFVAAVNPDGTFSFGGVSPGLYRLRVPGELDEDASNGPEAAEAGALVVVGTAPVSASLRLSRGRRVSGRVAAPAGLANGRTLRVTLTDQDGRAARSADVSCGADGASYSLDGIPDGRYRLDASDPGAPVIWTAPPVAVVVAGSDLDGRDLALVPAATIRARLSLARPLPDGTVEHVLVSAENSFLLPRGFSARATAVPYAAGGSVAARAAADGSVVDAEGRVVISGLLPGTYDVEFAGPSDAAPGGVAFVPARVSGVTVAAGQAADLGVVPLFSGASVSGQVLDAVTGLPVAGALVASRSSLRSGAPELRRDGPAATADASGHYVLRGLSPSVRWYDLTAGGPGHAASRVSSLDVSSGAARDFALAPAPATLTGRVASSDGAPLFSALGGAAAEAPGAALFLQRAGVTPADDPLADLALRTEPDGRFSIPSLATGSYRLTVTASGQAALVRSVALTGALADLGTLALGGGGAVSGSLRLPDGSPVPDDELRAVAAVTPDLSEFIYGSVTRDASARAAVAYRIGGLRAGRTYRVLALTADDEASMPAEGAAVVLVSTAEARVLDLVVRPPAPTISARSRRTGLRTTVEFLFSRPLRARSVADDDPSLVVSTVSASGVLSGARLSSDRRSLTVDYDAGVGESSFTLRASAPTSALDYDAVDPAAAREFVATATAAFYAGETGAHRAAVANAAGGVLIGGGDAARLVLPRGVFAVDASSTVTVILRRASSASGVSAASLPASLRAAAAALPATLPARSDFYEIELPAGVPSNLARPAQLTVVYSSAVTDPSGLNLYWYNPGSGQYVLQPDALGGAAVLDTAARSVTLNVGHFSTFVLLASGAGAIGGAAHAGDLEAYNFPNPFDLQIKSVTTIHGAGAQSVRGTMVRVGVPPGLSGQGKLRVFDATGRLIRTLDMGTLAAGQSYYQGWDGRNDGGRDVASGLYVGVIEIGSKRKSFKMAVIK
ncbi:MAG: FlgD immunoglobulin-like domain containing protein, partial [Elusimicrobia bacterium]|nr:FlgD immunoglobulin-like domain containing protein [Elusimicrobiota bacterium]